MFDGKDTQKHSKSRVRLFLSFSLSLRVSLLLLLLFISHPLLFIPIPPYALSIRSVFSLPISFNFFVSESLRSFDDDDDLERTSIYVWYREENEKARDINDILNPKTLSLPLFIYINSSPYYCAFPPFPHSREPFFYRFESSSFTFKMIDIFSLSLFIRLFF